VSRNKTPTDETTVDFGSLTGEETVFSPSDGPKSATDELFDADIILISHPDPAMLGRRYRLPPHGSLHIGRSSAADVSLPNVQSMSRLHARLRHQGDVVEIEDLASTNGTYLNDVRLEEPSILKSGDRFRVGAAHFKFLHEEDPEQAYHEALMSDGLTRAFNKRKFDEEMRREFERSRRHDRSLGLILFDLDHFKNVNDTHGHRCGDTVLEQIASLTASRLRPEQIFARVGGEEFGILSPETGIEGIETLAEKLRQEFEEFKVEHGEIRVQITCSFGVAVLSEEMWRPEDLYDAADQALYMSKNGGRNRVSRFRPPS
jgi:diguanylate cyclase (GGDEF)-like protein